MKLLIFFLTFALSLSLVCCSRDETKAQDVVRVALEYGGEAPVGVLYHIDAQEGSEGFLSPKMIKDIYGEDGAELFSLLEDYAVFISSQKIPYEVAVFKSRARSDGLKLELLLRQRRDTLSVALRGTSFYEMVDKIRIERVGDTVIFVLCPDPDRAMRKAKTLI